MKDRRRWLIVVVVLALVAGAYLVVNYTPAGRALLARYMVDESAGAGASQAQTSGGEANAQDGVADGSTVPVQPAGAILGAVSAAGNIALVSQQQIALAVDGMVDDIAVQAGDLVAEGDLLLSVDVLELERAVRRAELDVEDAKNRLDQLTEDASTAELALAQANLVEAQENLDDVSAGPGSDELEAAEAKATSALASYDELLEGPSAAELTQLSADMRKKEVALAEAQGEYDKIAWRNDSSMTSQAADLQQATIDYEAAVAAYQEATAPASESGIQSALSTLKDARHQLDELRKSPTAAEIATAEAKVADAKAALEDLLRGPSATELRESQIALEQALVSLEEAYSNLLRAKVTAPIDGAVLSVDAEVGERLGRGALVVTLADPRQLELTIDVAEIDIPRVQVGQSADVAIDAFPGRLFAGTVDRVSPTSDASSALVNYAVTIRLADDDLDGVLAGMTAVATIYDANPAANEGLLVPTNAIQEQGNRAVVMVMRDGASVPIRVEPGAIQGEWTVVQSSELEVGDEVVGSVTSRIGDDDGSFLGPGGPPDGNGGGGGGGPFRRND